MRWPVIERLNARARVKVYFARKAGSALAAACAFDSSRRAASDQQRPNLVSVSPSRFPKLPPCERQLSCAPPMGILLGPVATAPVLNTWPVAITTQRAAAWGPGPLPVLTVVHRACEKIELARTAATAIWARLASNESASLKSKRDDCVRLNFKRK